MRKGKKAFFLGITVGGLIGQMAGVASYRLGIDLWVFLAWGALILIAGTYYFEEYLENEA